MTYDYENCDFDEMLLYEYLDGLLDKEKSSLVTNHLSLCKSCRKKLSEMKLLFYELENLNEVEIPAEINKIRNIIVKKAFIENKTFLGKTYDNITHTTAKLGSSVITTITPTKTQVTKFAKNIYKKSTNKNTKVKNRKSKKYLLKNLGDLL